MTLVVSPRNRQRLRRGVWFHRLEPDFPNAVRRHGRNVLAGERHGDFLAVARRAPDRHARVALQDGVVLKQRVQFRRNSRRGDGEKQGANNFGCFFHGSKIYWKNPAAVYFATAALGMCVNLATACERERTCSFS